MTIEEQPHLLAGLGSSPFDAEGVRTRPSVIVKDGIVQHYILGSYSARRLGLQTTGNAGGTHNIIVKPGTHHFEALIKQLGTGLIVTEMMGHGVNAITGDYSRGATGFWVENGEIQYPVTGVTIAGNLRAMFQSIEQVGNDVDKRGNIQTGSLLLGPVRIAGSLE